MHTHLHLRRSLALALGALALASAPAPAMPADRAAGLTAQEQQVLASRGVGPITPAVDTAPVAPPQRSADPGFAWGSAAIGAGAAAGPIALVSLGRPALAGRRACDRLLTHRKGETMQREAFMSRIRYTLVIAVAAASLSPAVASAKGEHPKGAGRSRQVERLRQIEKSACRLWSTPTSPSPAG